MDFFDAQERSRRQTRNLILLFILATLAVAAAVTVIVGAAWLWTTQPGALLDPAWVSARRNVLSLIALGTLAFIALASLYRTAALRDGGDRIARELGATQVAVDTDDPLLRRLRNVVEEMAIASGVPVPDIYVLEREPGINAFAAGFRPEDAVVAVTRGALERLSRDELQGVIAHEFSHILNGDMRLNIRLMGPLFGIMVLGLLGRLILRSVRVGGSRRGRSGSAGGAVMILALGLVIIGYVGVFFARLIKAGVSRQREYLADASAVQFTRQSSGIAGALMKIAGLAEQSYLQRAEAEEVSHMLFATGSTALARLFATHPPLVDRIRRLDPTFKPEQVAVAGTEGLYQPLPEKVAGFAAGRPAAQKAPDASFHLSPEAVTSRVGTPDDAHVRAAHSLHASIPDRLYEAAHSSYESTLLGLALILHPETALRQHQLQLLRQQLGGSRTATIELLADDLRRLGPQYRLPLLDLAFPAIKNRPDGQIEYLRETIERLIHADNRVELFEYALGRVLSTGIERARRPGSRIRRARFRHGALRGALRRAFATLAAHGHDTAEEARAALHAGLTHLDPRLSPAEGDDLMVRRDEPAWQTELDEALALLSHLAPRHKRRLVASLAVTAAHDGRITVAESELLRVFCAVLDCPLPPLYAE